MAAEGVSGRQRGGAWLNDLLPPVLGLTFGLAEWGRPTIKASDSRPDFSLSEQLLKALGDWSPIVPSADSAPALNLHARFGTELVQEVAADEREWVIGKVSKKPRVGA